MNRCNHIHTGQGSSAAERAKTATLSAINATLGVTAVDFAIYDASQDSDAGWPLRTSGTAWHQSLGRFPGFGFIVAEASELHVYDNTDLSAAWKTFDFTGYTISSVAYRDGKIIVGLGVGVCVLDFPADSIDVEVTYSTSTSPAIVNNAVNAAAITVLDDAPINPATGLPVPTIAVGTDGGTSVINNGGTVADSTQTVGISSVWFGDNDRLFYVDEGSDQVYCADTYAADGFNSGGTHYDTDAAPYTLPGNVAAGVGNVLAHADGLTVLHENQGAKTSGMAAFIARAYNTGWMPGAVKGAYLCDSDDTDLVASTPFNDDFSTYADTTAMKVVWEDWPGATASLDAGTINIVTTSYEGSWVPVAVTVGQTYMVQVEVTAAATSTGRLYLGTPSDRQAYHNQLGLGVGVHTFFFTAINAELRLKLATTAAVGDVNFDNISVKRATPDRSVNGKGMIVNGTVTMTSIDDADGLALHSGVAGSGFYTLPYDAALDFGTGDFRYELVFTGQAGAWEGYFHRTSSDQLTAGLLLVHSSTNVISGRWNGSAKVSCDAPTSGVHRLALYRASGVLYLELDGEVVDSAVFTTDIDDAGATVTVMGYWQTGAVVGFGRGQGSFKVEGGARSLDQIAKSYRDELPLIQGKPCVLPGSSAAVLGVAADPITDSLHVTQADYHSEWQGLQRLSATADTLTGPVAAFNGMVALAGSSSVDVTKPAQRLGDIPEPTPRGLSLLAPQTYAGDASETDFTLPKGMKPYQVFNDGALVREGASEDYTISYDGFAYTVTFAVAPGSSKDVTIWPVMA
jgi:hypothetical protein